VNKEELVKFCKTSASD